MEEHTKMNDDGTLNADCQAIINQINPVTKEQTGETLTFLYYRGVAPFCPSDANEPSRWVANIWIPGFGFTTDPAVTIECEA